MKKLTALFVFAALAFVFVIAPTAIAHDGEDHADGSTHAENSDSESKEDANENYKYVAQAGDSYTVLARKAVQTYGVNNNINLSGAQIIFAETQLTQNAKIGELNEGQDIEISHATVKQAIEEAQKLNEKQQAAWEYYVQFVDFNTDANGQAS